MQYSVVRTHHGQLKLPDEAQIRLPLEERFWTCPECGAYLDRDENASINILNEGLKQLKNNKYLQNSNTLLYFNKMIKLNKYPDGTGESGTFVPKPIDTGLVTNLESELLIKDLNRRSSV